MPKAKDLAGLAALGALGYMLSKGKSNDDAGDQKTSSYTKDTKKVDAVDFKPTNESSYTPGNTGTARSGVGDATNDPLPKSSRSITPKDKAAPAAKDEATVTPSSRKTPGGDEKRAEGRKPMPSLRAVESRAASNKTDAMRNASRAQQAGINRQKAMAANPEAQAAERVYPEELLVGGPGVKVVGAAAKNLANRGGKEVVEYSTPRLAAPAKQLTGPSKTDLMARDRAAREAARQEQMLKENAANYGLNPGAPGYDAAASSLRKNIGGDDFTIMKKGGAVKMTASRRGDGIASRGKTRGKIC